MPVQHSPDGSTHHECVPKRRCLRFGRWKILLVAVLVIGLAAIIASVRHVRQAHDRYRRAVDVARATGGGVMTSSSAPDWLGVGWAGQSVWQRIFGPYVVGFSLAGTTAGDDQLARLTALPEVDTLDLSGTHVTDEGLAQLAAVPGFWALYLADTKITDRGLEHLKQLKKLKYLNLNNTPITDAAVPNMAEMTNLYSLEVNGTAITPEGVEKLHNALPEIWIVYEGTPLAPLTMRRDEP